MLAKSFTWMLREGLASVVVSVIWFAIMIPLLLCVPSAGASHRKAEPAHRKSKTRYKRKPDWSEDITGLLFIRPQPAGALTRKARLKSLDETLEEGLAMLGHAWDHYTTLLRDQACLMSLCMLHACWRAIQDFIFGMRTRRRAPTSRRARSSATYYVAPTRKRGSRIGRKRRKWARLMCFATLFQHPVASTARTAFSSGLSQPLSAQRRFAAFDCDSVALRVDNCCTASITNSLADVVGEPIPIKARIEGFTGGKALVTARCTIKWRVEDDNGRVHHVLLPNSLYSKAAPFRLLSPQHWAQQADDHHPKREGTWCGTLSDRVELERCQRKFKRTVHLDPATKMALFHTAPSYAHQVLTCPSSGGVKKMATERLTQTCVRTRMNLSQDET